MKTPVEWWQDLPVKDQILYATLAGTATGGIAGGFTAERPLIGVLFGGLLGFVAATAGLGLYYGYRTITAPSRLLP